MFRGRAAKKLADQSACLTRQRYTCCPYENLEDPDRVHIDPYGNVHICQGIVLGNLLEKPLQKIATEFNPRQHPILGPLIIGGPVELACSRGVAQRERYADACHFCYEVRDSLRARFPEILRPPEIYGRKSLE